MVTEGLKISPEMLVFSIRHIVWSGENNDSLDLSAGMNRTVVGRLSAIDSETLRSVLVKKNSLSEPQIEAVINAVNEIREATIQYDYESVLNGILRKLDEKYGSSTNVLELRRRVLAKLLNDAGEQSEPNDENRSDQQ